MYSNPSIAVPVAATGATIATLSGATTLNGLFIFCAMFALIGAIFALKRTLPVPTFVHEFRAKQSEIKLRDRRNRKS